MDEARRTAYLDALGVVRWVPRSPISAAVGPTAAAALDHSAAVAVTPVPAVSPSPPVPAMLPAGARSEIAGMDWEALQGAVAGCRACALCDGRTQTVFGTGDRSAAWLVIGEAPGAEEDRQGVPFVGAAGQLLNRMLQAVGLAREAVYIANTLKCRPPSNRNPRPDELLACRPFLERQIALVRPRLLLAVGRIAAQALLDSSEPIGRLRGRVHRLPGTDLPLVATYHPAYLLREPAQKRRAWQDLLLARAVVDGDPGGGAF